MRLGKIGQMAQVMRVQYENEFRAIAAILAEESEVRTKLNRLDVQIAANQDACANSHALKVVGAQLMWQGWTTRTRRQLNTELAQIMAKKLIAMDRVRVAFGRQRAVEMMMATRRKDQRKRRVTQREINLLSLG